jgi:aminopeptidase N
MLHTLLGEKGFRQGSDLYFERHDGQAVTCDDFIQAMEDANGADLELFKRWYSQAGTPQLAVESRYDASAGTFTLLFRQSCPPTPGQPDKLPQVIPVRMALLDSKGHEMPLQLEGESVPVGNERVLAIAETEQAFTFVGLSQEPLPSLLRGFSAPVKMSYPYSRDDRVFLAKHDPDGFNRWEAGQGLALEMLQGMIDIHRTDRPLLLDQRLRDVFHTLLTDSELDPAMVAEMLKLPSEAYLVEVSEVADVDAIHSVREWARAELANTLADIMWPLYKKLDDGATYTPDAAAIARRSLKNTLLSYLMLTGSQEAVDACVRQYVEASNMTDRQAALVCLVNSEFVEQKQAALNDFAERWQNYPLVMDQWFSVQAAAAQPGGLARVEQLLEHPLFSMRNPNKIRAVIGAFANQNLLNFHAADGSGYQFLAERILQLDPLNPQVAARLLTPLTRWRKYDGARQELLKAELSRIMAAESLSPDVYEVVSKSLL